MSSIPSLTASDVQLLCEYLSAFGQHHRMFRLGHLESGGKVVVSTFAGENSRFGQKDAGAAWSLAKSAMQDIVGPIHFIPAFFDPARHSEISCLDGVFNWNGGWPLHLTPSHPRNEVENARLDTDADHLRNLEEGKIFMAAVSPWFFTHYGPDSWDKNWIYRGDDWLLVRRWQQLIAERSHVDIVQVISWNDYGESHYICPTIRGAQPNSQKWVDGLSHGAWTRLNGYFARAFRAGEYPRIERDEIFMWARLHSRSSIALADLVPRPRNWELTDDTYWVVVLSTAQAQVSMYAGDKDIITVDIGAGLTLLSRPLVVREGMKVTLQRDGDISVECDAVGFTFEDEPDVYNFNASTYHTSRDYAVTRDRYTLSQRPPRCRSLTRQNTPAFSYPPSFYS
ncbi:glycoside hydrolase family 71 protein [Mycena amicta]|nr:glycoside hydrolase family 71 protein [Mycena amicta]